MNIYESLQRRRCYLFGRADGQAEDVADDGFIPPFKHRSVRSFVRSLSFTSALWDIATDRDGDTPSLPRSLPLRLLKAKGCPNESWTYRVAVVVLLQHSMQDI